MRGSLATGLLAVLAFSVLAVGVQAGKQAGPSGTPELPVETILQLFDEDQSVRARAVKVIDENWNINLAPMILEVLYLVNFQEAGERTRLWRLLKRKTGQRLEHNPFVWLQWLWQQEYSMHPDYPRFKGDFYGPIDERFRWWFYAGMKQSIRLDEVVWGGVQVDGIPPLEAPATIVAAEADYLGDNDVVFGVFINGEARAYPKRILAWHELFNDNVGNTAVTCAYCTLCGSAVLYRQHLSGRQFEFGTSGFLYRSNKLMYDRQTRTLWSALEGIPVLGKLVGENLRLERLPIVTTTWGEWRQRHPTTRVLSLDTGFTRDYREGVAYKDYFSSEELMFPVPRIDGRLANKAEVLALLLSGRPVAYSASFLETETLVEDRVGTRKIVILTDPSGANRVYSRQSFSFSQWDGRDRLRDGQGGDWRVTEEKLLGPGGEELERLPSHRAFWFGWNSQFPGTRLVTSRSELERD